MTFGLPWLAWFSVFGLAIFLRFDGLGERPFHADEATGARITAQRMSVNDYVFDPLHYHGPSLTAVGAVAARFAGAESWPELEKRPLRWVTAIGGSLLVLTPLLGFRRFGHGPMLVAALALATSPLLVYYSRMYIHEILLALCGLLALGQVAVTRRWWLAGIWVGLMFATKETFAISLLAWGGAAALVYLVTWLSGKEVPSPSRLLREQGPSLLLAGGLAVLTSMAFYTNGFTYWQGGIDAFRTYFVYELVEGHDKPFGYYLRLMLWPEERGGYWWFETPVAVLAGIAFFGRGFASQVSRGTRVAIQFLGVSVVLHALAYSVIGYKTPWLIVFPWAQLLVLAGFAASFRPRPVWGRVVLGLVLAAFFIVPFQLARQATGPLASDDRNPYAYVPTSEDLEALGPWLDSLDAAVAEIGIEPLGVVGREYWPLPWYLRSYAKVGYWPEAPDGLERLAVVLTTEELSEQLMATHVPVPRGLRVDRPMTVWVRNDVWDAALRER